MKSSRRPRRNRCVFQCKMRLAFISTVNLREMYVRSPANPGEIVVFSHVNAPGLHLDCKFICRSRQPHRILCVFSCTFLRRSRQPRRNRCVFSCKMRLGFILTVYLFVNLANPGEIVVFSHVKCAEVMRVHSLVDFSAFQWSFCSHESRDTTK